MFENQHIYSVKLKRKLIKAINFFLPFPNHRQAAVIFLFHTVEKEWSPWTCGHRYITPVNQFKKQIRYIKKHFDVVSTSKLVNILRHNSFGERDIAAIHFDDGFDSYADIALPVLKEEGITSTVFLVYNMVIGDIPIRNKLAFCLNVGGKKDFFKTLKPLFKKFSGKEEELKNMNVSGFLSWSKNNFDSEHDAIVHEYFQSILKPTVYKSPFMDLEGVNSIVDDPFVEIGSHTLTHSMLSSLSESDQYREIIQGHNKIENLIKRKTDFFAYPYGGIPHFTEVAKKIAQENGLVAFSTYGGINDSFDTGDIRRVTLANHSSLEIKLKLLSC